MDQSAPSVARRRRGACHIRAAVRGPPARAQRACAPVAAVASAWSLYARRMGELLEAAANIGLVLLLLGLLAALGYQLFGPVALGLPAMLGAFVFVAVILSSTESASVGLLTAVLGVIVIFLVIGLAMTYGDEWRRPRGGG
jgi:hypothetical protein